MKYYVIAQRRVFVSYVVVSVVVVSRSAFRGCDGERERKKIARWLIALHRDIANMVVLVAARRSHLFGISTYF